MLSTDVAGALHRRLLALAGVEAGALAALAWWPGVPLPHPGLLLFVVAFAAYLAAAAAVLGHPADREPRGAGLSTTLVLVALAGLAFRAALLPVPPELSDDVWRYLWDGHVQLHGVNPYRFAPSAPELAGIRTPWHGLINHPDVSTIYPPVAEIAFAAVAAVGSGVTTAKLLWLALDAACAVILVRIARATRRPPEAVLLLYYWSPLLVVETAWSAHLEPLGLAAAAGVVLLDVRRRRWGTGAAAGVATAVKLAPGAALPALLRRGGWRLGAAFAATVGALWLPYVGAGPRLWAGLSAYVESWRFNEGAFLVLEAALPSTGTAKAAAAVVVAAVVAWTAVRRFDAERALFWVVGTGLVVAPTVHPWYLLWILPFAALRASRAWILLTGLVFLAYHGLGSYLEAGAWPHPGWLRALIWGPFFLLLALDALSSRGSEDPGPSRTPPTPSAR